MSAKAATGESSAARERSKVQKRNPEFDVALGARIRAARIVARMSQSTLGEAIGISFQQVQKYEHGKDRVAASTLQGIAAALGVHPGSFFDVHPSVPLGSVDDAVAVVKTGQRLQRVRDPLLLRRLLALADVLAKPSNEVPLDADDQTI